MHRHGVLEEFERRVRTHAFHPWWVSAHPPTREARTLACSAACHFWNGLLLGQDRVRPREVTPADLHLRVDLLGRLSNPPETLESIAGQGVEGAREPLEEPRKQAICSPVVAESDLQETPGRLSNPGRKVVQRRLNEVEIDQLVCEYQTGRTLADLAAELGIHHRTVAAHLEARGVPRRVNRRKMTDDDLSEAARRYREGDSLAKVALSFDVDAATVRRELHRAGVAIRPRRPGVAGPTAETQRARLAVRQTTATSRAGHRHGWG